MPDPEIVRRCPHCGASIRVRAFFCPQCGQQLVGGQAVSEATMALNPSDLPSFGETVGEGLNEQPSIAEPPAIEVPPKSTPNNLKNQKKQKKKARHVSATLANTQQVRPNTQQAPAAPADTQQAPPAPAKTQPLDTSNLAVTQEFRPTAAARRAIDSNVMPRVESWREVSSVVIDEATYDPSLRFVLVAALLFVIFLVIVVWSKLIG